MFKLLNRCLGTPFSAVATALAGSVYLQVGSGRGRVVGSSVRGVYRAVCSAH